MQDFLVAAEVAAGPNVNVTRTGHVAFGLLMGALVADLKCRLSGRRTI